MKKMFYKKPTFALGPNHRTDLNPALRWAAAEAKSMVYAALGPHDPITSETNVFTKSIA